MGVGRLTSAKVEKKEEGGGESYKQVRECKHSVGGGILTFVQPLAPNPGYEKLEPKKTHFPRSSSDWKVDEDVEAFGQNEGAPDAAGYACLEEAIRSRRRTKGRRPCTMSVMQASTA